MASYSFPRMTGSGHLFHILYKIELTFGVKALKVVHTGDKTTVYFTDPLTPQQELDLEALITDPDPYSPDFPGYLDDGGNTLYIRDIFYEKEWFDAFVASIGISGLQATMWFVSTGDYGTKKDGVMLKFNKLLTNQDKKAIKAAYEANANWGAWS